jgi:hypothetical protein
MEWSWAEWNWTKISFHCLDIQWWNETNLSLYRLGSERNEINYNFFFPILQLFKNIGVEEIIKRNKKKCKIVII